MRVIGTTKSGGGRNTSRLLTEASALLAVAFALLQLGTGGFARANAASATETAGEASGWVAVGDDMVVPAEHADRLAASGEGQVDEGFNYLIDPADHHLGGYTFVLKSSSGIESYRSHATTAASNLASITGGTYSVRGGTTAAAEPAAGEILIEVSSTSPCDGSGWVGCGGPREAIGDGDGTGWQWTAGHVWLHPDLLSYSSATQLEVLLHEVGHAMGLSHYSTMFEGYYQVMRTPCCSTTAYRSGDINGLTTLDPPGAPANDQFASATNLTGWTGTSSGTNTWATKQGGEPAHAGGAGGRSVWWKWTAPGPGTVTIDTAGSGIDTLLGIYTGSSVGSLTHVASNDDYSGISPASRVQFSTAEGTTYRIAVDGWSGGAGSIKVNWSWEPDRPDNDDLADAAVSTLSAPDYETTMTGNNAWASKESGEPTHAATGKGASVWWKWTAPWNGTLTADTEGSAVDTVLAIYEGTSPGALTLQGDNDDVDLVNTWSQVVIPVVSGHTYRIAVDSKATEGDVTLNLIWDPTRPANNDFSGTTKTGNSFSATGSTQWADKQPLEPNHAGNSGGASVWWSWAAPGPGLVTADTSGSAFDTTLAAYSGDALGSLVEVESNNDVVDLGTRSRIVFRPEPDETYRLALDGLAGAKGAYSFNLSYDPCDHTQFPDVGKANVFCADITWLIWAKITEGYKDGTYRPNLTVSRQSMAAFLYRAAGSPAGPFPDPGLTDVGPTHPFYDEIAYLVDSGIAGGYKDGTFRPADPVSRQSMAAFLYRAAGSPAGPFPDPGLTDVGPTHPFYDEIAYLVDSGIAGGYKDGTFRPTAFVSRQSMAKFLRGLVEATG